MYQIVKLNNHKEKIILTSIHSGNVLLNKRIFLKFNLRFHINLFIKEIFLNVIFLQLFTGEICITFNNFYSLFLNKLKTILPKLLENVKNKEFVVPLLKNRLHNTKIDTFLHNKAPLLNLVRKTFIYMFLE